MRSLPRPVWLRLALLALIILAGGVYAWVVGLPTLAESRALVADFGVLGLVAFVLLYALITLMPVPASALTVVAGVLFGAAEGFAVGLVGATLGAYTAFWLGRLLGRGAVERLTGSRVSQVDAMLRRRGLLAVLGVRLIPVVPFVAVNYAAGLTAVRQRDYAVGTVLGIVPSTIAYVVIGAYGTNPLSGPFIVAAGALLLLAAGSWIAVRRTNRVKV